MKTKFIVSLFFLSFLVNGQNTIQFVCFQDIDENINNIGIQNASTYANCTYNGIYENEVENISFIPTENSPVYMIRLNLNIMQQDDGSGNFTNTISHIKFLHRLISDVNYMYSHIQQPVWNGVRNDPYIVDSRIQFRIDNINFIKNSSISHLIPYDEGTNTDIFFSQYGIDIEHSINIFFSEFLNADGTPYTALAGNGFGLNGENRNCVSMRSYYYAYNHLSTCGCYETMVYCFAHELGHALGLMHTHQPDELSDTYYPDVGSCDCYSAANCSNNVMSYSAQRYFFSPLQIGKMRKLMTEGWRTKIVDNCNHNEPTKIITEDKIWNVPQLFSSDVKITNGATVTLKCKAYLPQQKSIIIMEDSKLIINGGSVLNVCGEPVCINVGNGGYLEITNSVILDNCIINVFNGGSLKLTGNLILKNGSSINVLKNGYFCFSDNSTLNLATNNTFLRLHQSYNIGINTNYYNEDYECLNSINLLSVVGNTSNIIYGFSYDLYIRDNAGIFNWGGDIGIEPNTTVNEHYRSPDIKIVDYNTLNEVSSLDPNKDYKIKVTIRNRGIYTSSAGAKLRVYWAKAGINESWPNQWNGSTTNCAGSSVPIVTGGLLGEVAIPAGITYNGYKTVLVDWKATDRPRFTDYQECINWINGVNSGDNYEENIWHYCLLAVIDDGNEVQNLNATSAMSLRDFVFGSNNVASVNVQFLPVTQTTSVINVLQPAFALSTPFNININLEPYLLKYAEIYIKLSENLLNAWQKAGMEGQNIKLTKNGWLVTGENAILSNILLSSNELNTLQTSIYFLSKEMPEKSEFEFDISMNIGGVNYGGEHYVIVRDLDRYFAVQAHAEAEFTDKTLKLTAESINEPAYYVWYDQSGKEISEGREIEIELPKKSGWYKLEVIAEMDKYKDYDSVLINIPNGFIASLTPNPATNEVKIEYFLSDVVQTANIKIYNTLGNVVKQEILNINEKEKNISLSRLLQGNYSVVLTTNNLPSDFKNLVKQ